jgi:NADPH2:quinone reductase
MKAIRVHQTGGVEVLSYDDIPTPEPAQGEVRFKVEAAGLNFIDTYKRAGIYKIPLPSILGEEAAGVVDAIGAGVSEFKPGDRVACGFHGAAYAEWMVAPAWKVVAVPDGVSTQQAAAVMLQGMTAHYLARSTYVLGPNDTALIHAAAGGTGALLVQIAKKSGARVFGTVSTPEKATLAKAAGVDEVIFYTEQDFEAEVKRLTNGKGVDVVYDSVGRTTFLKSLNCLHPRGMMVLFGAASGPVDPIDPQILNQKGSLYLTRPSLGAYVATRQELTWRAQELFDWMAKGELTVRIDAAFLLQQAADAHRYIEGRQTKGKVLLIP